MIIAYNIFNDSDVMRFNFYHDSESNRQPFLGRVFEIDQHDKVIGDVRSYSFNTNNLQALMDALWEAGIKPTELKDENKSND